MKSTPWPVIVLAAMAVGLAGACLIWSWQPWPIIQTIATGLTVVVVWWYTIETRTLREIASSQVRETQAQGRGVYRPYLEVEAVSNRLDLINRGLGPALEVTIAWPPMRHPGHDEMDATAPIFDRVPIVTTDKAVSVKARLEWDADGRGAMAPEVDFEMLARRTISGMPFDIVVSYRDLGLFPYSITHRFREGRTRAEPLPGKNDSAKAPDQS